MTIGDFDECGDSDHNDCSSQSDCINTEGSYTCKCREGFHDLSGSISLPGRVCSGEHLRFYRLVHLVGYFAWFYFEFVCSTFCLVLLGVVVTYQNWLIKWANTVKRHRSRFIQPNYSTFDHMDHLVHTKDCFQFRRKRLLDSCVNLMQDSPNPLKRSLQC